MPAPYPTDTLDEAPRTPASDVKKLGWRGVMKTVHRHGKVVVTNHNEPEAVILPVAEYERLMERVQAAGERDRAVVAELRARYDARLAWLQEPGAHEVMDSIFDKPLKLGGKIFTGREF